MRTTLLPLNLAAIWAYRDFVLGSVAREIRARYRGSLLGAAWIVIGPLTMILIYTLIFSQVMHARLPGVGTTYAYSIYLCAGLLPWGVFAEILQRSQNVFLDNANLLKKASFPPLSLLAVVVLTAAFNFLVIITLFLVFLFLVGHFPGWNLVYALPGLLLLFLLATSAGLFLGVINVFFRDVGQLTGVGLQMLFWFTPIVYPVTIVPAWAREWLAMNPLYALVGQFQTIFLGADGLDFYSLAYPSVWAVGAIFLALIAYSRLYSDMVDEL